MASAIASINVDLPVPSSPADSVTRELLDRRDGGHLEREARVPTLLVTTEAGQTAACLVDATRPGP